MQILAFLILLFPFSVLAKAPECPGFANRKDCLMSVEDNYQKYLDFMRYEEKDEDQLLLVARDIKHFESLACKKTCVN